MVIHDYLWSIIQIITRITVIMIMLMTTIDGCLDLAVEVSR